MTQPPPSRTREFPPGTPHSPPEDAGPIATATASLREWLSRSGVPVRLAPPGAGGDAAAPGVCLWPLAVLPEQATRRPQGRDPLRLRVRYLIHTGGADPTDDAVTEEFDRILTSLPDSTVHLVLDPVTLDTWRGFGVSPQLGLYLDVVTQASAPSPAPPRVRAAMRLSTEPLARVHGMVLGPGGVPVPGMRVVEQQTGAATYTGNRGEFAFPAVPAGGPTRLRLSGRGQHLVAEVAEQSDEPIIIHCDLEGD